MKQTKKVMYEGNLRITIEEVEPEEEAEEQEQYSEEPMPGYPPYYPLPYMIDPNQMHQQGQQQPIQRQQRPMPPIQPPLNERRVQDRIRGLPPLPPPPLPPSDFEEEVELQEPPADEVADFLKSHPNAFQSGQQEPEQPKKKGFLGFGRKKK